MNRQPLPVLFQPQAVKLGKLTDRRNKPRTVPQWPMLANVIFPYQVRPLLLAMLDQPAIQPRRVRQFRR
ncbi:MAG: hypothetical protein IPF74_09915 [Rhodocyclaceae bacterium]|nr:hypothetical protein [Rhodocyclaceae bacterium]